MGRRYICESTNGTKIKPTAEWMRHWYDKMNKELFNGSLGDCHLGIFTKGKGSNGKVLGCFRLMAGNNLLVNRNENNQMFTKFGGTWRVYITRNNFVEECQPSIQLNGNYVATEDAWINTLVHEMCHYYTYMEGYVPKQSHGKEFKAIAAIVAQRSNGKITIQRLASSEEMKNYELDDKIKQKNQEKKDRQLANTMAYTVVMADGSIRLILSTSRNLLGDIKCYHRDKGNISFLGWSQSPSLISFLTSYGYKKRMRAYRYWDVTSNKEVVDAMANANFNKSMGSCATFREAIGLADDTNKSYLGYKIVQDDNGYNLIDKNKNRTFQKSVNKLWFDKDINAFRFKMGKFSYKGTPGHWVKDDMVEEAINRVIRETIENMVSRKKSNTNIIIPMDANLGLASPFELAGSNS